MPGMNGIETTKKICDIYSQKNAELPAIIGQSGDSDENLYNQCKKAGITDNISKPFSFREFQDLLREHRLII